MAEEKFDAIKEFTNLRDSLSKAVEQGIRKSTNTPVVLVDVYETADSVIVRTNPIDGAGATSIEVTMENNILTIQGETTPDEGFENLNYLSRERVFGKFTREVKITLPVKANEAKAKFKNGVLTVTIPKISDSRPQIIDVIPTE